jgi:hypothetical protein
MKVFFRSKWFGPDGYRRRANTVSEVPDSWTDKLPKSAMIVEDEVKTGPLNPKLAKPKVAKVEVIEPVEEVKKPFEKVGVKL